MEKRQKEFLEALENGLGYDYIARNYYDFTKEELKDICLELLYNLPEQLRCYVADDLKERWDIEG